LSAFRLNSRQVACDGTGCPGAVHGGGAVGSRCCAGGAGAVHAAGGTQRVSSRGPACCRWPPAGTPVRCVIGKNWCWLCHCLALCGTSFVDYADRLAVALRWCNSVAAVRTQNRVKLASASTCAALCARPTCSQQRQARSSTASVNAGVLPLAAYCGYCAELSGFACAQAEAAGAARGGRGRGGGRLQAGVRRRRAAAAAAAAAAEAEAAPGSDEGSSGASDDEAGFPPVSLLALEWACSAAAQWT